MTVPGPNPSGSGPPPRPTPPAPRRSGPLVTLIVLILSAAALFAAGMSTLSLPSLDDAMYARKGVEMARAGGGFTVTWAGRPWFENPPLQFWLLALSFRLFGEGDGAARLPALLMGCATLLLTFLLGRRLLDEKAALAGVALLLLSPIYRRRTTPGGFLLAVWVLLPIVLYSFSAAQSNRYLYPILPALALCAGHWLRRTLPRVERHLATRAAPAAALAAAVTFAVSPASLTRDLNGPFKRDAQRIQARAPGGHPLPYLGDRYWEMVNPLLYYTERTLVFPPESNPADAVAAALEHPARRLLCDRDRLAELTAAAGRPARTVAEGARWVLLEFT